MSIAAEVSKRRTAARRRTERALAVLAALEVIDAHRTQPIDDDEPVISYSGGTPTIPGVWSGMAATKLVDGATLAEVVIALASELER